MLDILCNRTVETDIHNMYAQKYLSLFLSGHSVGNWVLSLEFDPSLGFGGCSSYHQCITGFRFFHVGSVATLCLFWGLGCWRDFLCLLAPPFTFSRLCKPEPQRSFVLMPLPSNRLLLLFAWNKSCGRSMGIQSSPVWVFVLGDGSCVSEPQGGAFSVYLSLSQRQNTSFSYFRVQVGLLFISQPHNWTLSCVHGGEDFPGHETVSCSPPLNSALRQWVSLGKTGCPAFPQWLKAFVCVSIGWAEGT